MCIARVPALHLLFLADVSRAWRNLIRSPLPFSVRLQPSVSHHFLLINILNSKDESQWYLFDRSHSAPLIRLAAPPFYPIFSISCFTAVARGHTLFLLGGYFKGIPTPLVQIYDARHNCWRLGPLMFSPRTCPAAGVIFGQIYVVGGCHPANNDNWWQNAESKHRRAEAPAIVPGIIYLNDIRVNDSGQVSTEEEEGVAKGNRGKAAGRDEGLRREMDEWSGIIPFE